MAWRRPETWKVAVFALAVGCCLGAATAALEAARRPWHVGGFRPDGPVPDAAAPRAEADATVHAFGRIGTGATGRHVFTIRNAGTVPLTLSRGASSCSCTIGDLGGDGDGDATRKVVPPGGSLPVTVQWTGKGDGGPFRQQVTILTDDPRRPEIPLVVEGTVVPTWQAVPPALVLPRIAAMAGDRVTSDVFTFGAEPPRVRSATIDGDDASTRFAVSTTALPTDLVASREGATGGFRVDVEVKPGLPLGRLRRTVTVAFDMDGEMTAEIPLEGSVEGDLSVAGPGWDRERQALVLGAVSGKAGMRTTVFLTAKGPHRDSVRPTLREVVPGSLEVRIGAAAPIGTGAVVRTAIEVIVPPGSRPANHICSAQGPAGRIVFDTGHPDSPTLTIPVCIAIGP
jgi:hypothetical protein